MRDYIFDIAWSLLDVEPAKLSEIAENREAFRALLRLQPPLHFPEKKRLKMNERAYCKQINEFCVEYGSLFAFTRFVTNSRTSNDIKKVHYKRSKH